MTTRKTSLAESILIIIVALGIMFIQCVVGGYVGAKLWLWFIVPIFGLPALSIAQVVGISSVVQYFSGQLTTVSLLYDLKKSTSIEEQSPWMLLAEGLLRTVVLSSLILFLGWIVTLCL